MKTTDSSLIVHQFPCLSDNYGFLIHDPESKLTASIDSPDADAILRELSAKQWSLSHIFNTHHHADHAGGNLKLKEITGCTIVAAANDANRIPGIDIQVSDGESFQFGRYTVRVMETPGHTLGHIIYYLPEANTLFAGDTLFSGGCGRLFEGTPEQMWSSLNKIMTLPEDTRIYCAHEYTLSNLEFALSIDSNNPDLEQYYSDVKKLRSNQQATIPTTLERELKINPFLRPDAPGIRNNLNVSDNVVAQFTEIRQRKDQF